MKVILPIFIFAALAERFLVSGNQISGINGGTFNMNDMVGGTVTTGDKIGGGSFSIGGMTFFNGGMMNGVIVENGGLCAYGDFYDRTSDASGKDGMVTLEVPEDIAAQLEPLAKLYSYILSIKSVPVDTIFSLYQSKYGSANTSEKRTEQKLDLNAIAEIIQQELEGEKGACNKTREDGRKIMLEINEYEETIREQVVAPKMKENRQKFSQIVNRAQKKIDEVKNYINGRMNELPTPSTNKKKRARRSR